MTPQGEHQVKMQQGRGYACLLALQRLAGPIMRIAHSPGTPSDVPPLPPDRDPDIIIVPPRNPPTEQPEDFPPPVPPPPPADRPRVPPRVAAQRQA